MKHKFYDIHFHSLDLSHANLTAFISRISFLSQEENNSSKPHFFGRIGSFFKKVIRFPKQFKAVKQRAQGKFANTRNLLSFMESSIRYDFLILDHFLKKSKKDALIKEGNTFSIDGVDYNKIVLCPLIIDFGHQSKLHQDFFYNLPTKKPIQDQVVDLLESINTYFNHEMKVKLIPGPKGKPIQKLSLQASQEPKEDKLFEIYPFLGINTANYTLSELKNLIDKYFEGYEVDTPEQRQAKLFDKMGEFIGRNLNEEQDYTYLFAGIKVYPPIGFDPYPENNPLELQKVNYLYEACIHRQIPITTHCSDGGFIVSEHSDKFTNPGSRWAKVLNKYPELRINFAHFGSQGEKQDHSWRDCIIDFADIYPQVYTDISCLAIDDQYYKQLNKILVNAPDSLKDRLLFGSDFVINLLWSKSYNHYLIDFQKTKHIQEKQRYCQRNAETFLFGDHLEHKAERSKNQKMTYSHV